MKISYFAKIKAYRFFNSRFGKKILGIFSRFVTVKNLKSFGRPKFPFIVAMTIDTESGYVEENDFRVWQHRAPRAYMGYHKGIENWRKVLNSHNARATFFLSTNCFSSSGKERNKIINQLSALLKENHEIGLHLHPDSDLAIQQMLGEKFEGTSAKFYSRDQISKIINSGKNIIRKNLNITVSSFRWGNWALNTDCVSALEENGLKIDSSATPGIKGHLKDEMAFDWSKATSHYPWILSKEDYQDTSSFSSKVLEVPIATFNFLGITLRADPANSVLLNACFDYYYKNADRSKKPFVFVVISHSIEGTYKDGTKTKVLTMMEEFLKHTQKFNVEFKTLKESLHFFDATTK